ncbi:MAG: CapA family protein [Candidatus Doudnabacteria bacterium]|nr:CapA family protein [Candidatus Doudnabacteria bacterium]
MSKLGNKNLRNAEFNSASQQRDPESSSGLRVLILLSLIVIVIVILTVLPKTKKAQAPTDYQSTTTYNLKPTTLFFAGDIMLSRNVHDKMADNSDFSLPFQNVKNEINAADISFANLESPFNDKGLHFVPNSLVFNADPQSVAGLKAAGFDVLSTANNHALDQGLKGLNFTIDHLVDNGIIPTGTSRSEGDAVLPVIKSQDILYGFLSYTYSALNDGGQSSSPYVDTMGDLKSLQQDIWAHRGHTADVIIVSMHAGTEYTRTPTEQQIAFAHAAIDAGAEMVIGHHPHWIQSVEQYKGKWIFYSLGNFVFDQMWSAETREGLTITMTMTDDHITKIELRPVIIENYCCPRWANEEESLAILKKINLTSSILVNNN